MKHRSLLAWPLLVIGIATLLGCRANDQGKQAEPRRAQAKRNTDSSGSAKLSLLRTISLPADALRVKRMAISNDGSYVAVVDADSVEDRLHIWSLGSGKLVYSLKPGYALSDISWSPRKQELAYSGASGEPMSPHSPIYRGFGFIDMPGKRLRTILNLQFGENIPFDWTPDGKRLVTDFSVFDLQTRQNVRYRLDGNTLTVNARNVAISLRRMMAEEVVDSRTGLPSIRIFKATSSDFTWHKAGELPSELVANTNETVIRTQPRFLADGRLGYIWALLDPYSNPKAVEIKTCNEQGQDEQSWAKLPNLGQGVEGRYSSSPVAWTANQRTLALVDKQSIRILRVDARR